ncbi:hypothetical protein E2C01_056069 [Portunus trituberculatus]|uniref:Uncharacterized protein n=1 Tax=Portunus trituberculatus TaxID=210409 RepID=A0A5B7GPE3_PORTR|nr:hypothetical protein [Portunus trituberculatus]
MFLCVTVTTTTTTTLARTRVPTCDLRSELVDKGANVMMDLS